MTRQPRRSWLRRGVYRSRNSRTWAGQAATLAAALAITAAIVLATLALADLYARSTT